MQNATNNNNNKYSIKSKYHQSINKVSLFNCSKFAYIYLCDTL